MMRHTTILLAAFVLLTASKCHHEPVVDLCQEEKGLATSYSEMFQATKAAESPTVRDVDFVSGWAFRDSWDNHACEEYMLPRLKNEARDVLRKNKEHIVPVLKNMCDSYVGDTEDVGLEMYYSELRRFGTKGLNYLNESTDGCNTPPHWN